MMQTEDRAIVAAGLLLCMDRPDLGSVGATRASSDAKFLGITERSNAGWRQGFGEIVRQRRPRTL
jgi:hypothetical protein